MRGGRGESPYGLFRPRLAGFPNQRYPPRSHQFYLFEKVKARDTDRCYALLDQPVVAILVMPLPERILLAVDLHA